MGDVDEEIRKAQESRGHGFGEATDDEHSTSNKFAGFESSIGTGEVEEDDGEEETRAAAELQAPKHLLDVPSQEGEADPLAGKRSSNRIADREDEYRRAGGLQRRARRLVLTHSRWATRRPTCRRARTRT